MNFEQISPFELNNNFFKALNNDWALLCSGNPVSEKECNIMTISWGGIGILWNKPIAICYVRPQRYTFEFIEKTGHFSINFFESEKYRNELNLCGTKSGRDVNKFLETSFKLKKYNEEYVGIEEAKLILNCKVLYADFLKETNFLDKEVIKSFYPKKDFHKFFIGEINNILQAK